MNTEFQVMYLTRKPIGRYKPDSHWHTREVFNTYETARLRLLELQKQPGAWLFRWRVVEVKKLPDPPPVLVSNRKTYDESFVVRAISGMGKSKSIFVHPSRFESFLDAFEFVQARLEKPGAGAFRWFINNRRISE